MSALRTEEYFAERAARGDLKKAFQVLKHGGNGGPEGPHSLKEIGGGGGIRTRVRKYIPAGIYDAYPLLKSRSRRREAAKNRRKPAPENLVADVRNNASATSLLK